MGGRRTVRLMPCGYGGGVPIVASAPDDLDPGEPVSAARTSAASCGKLSGERFGTELALGRGAGAASE